jgi:hypothetical protein
LVLLLLLLLLLLLCTWKLCTHILPDDPNNIFRTQNQTLQLIQYRN